jgi:predicted O-methyltransferase YrrM
MSGIADITFGIVSFDRPALLSRLLASIDRFYPGATVAIAENGLTGWWDKTLETEDGRRKVYLLPFDAGCAAARNCLIDRCRTKYLLFLEEDFVFTDSTNVQQIVDVLDADPSVGMCGGKVFPGPSAPLDSVTKQTTATGVHYFYAKTLRMFAAGRREFFADHRFDELLKTGEHGPFMTKVIKAAKWRLAFCPATNVWHRQEPDAPEYVQYRARATEFRDRWKRHLELEEYLTLTKDRTTRSLFGQGARSSFGRGDVLFLDHVLARHKKWKNCVELGTGSGLTTLYLAVAFLIRGGTVATYDVRKKPVGTFHEHFFTNVTFTECDVIPEAGPLAKIRAELSKPNTFVFFDNGNKRKEVSYYARCLKPGSGFIVHDWPREFGPEDVPEVLALGFEEYGTGKAELLQSCCRCFVRTQANDR